MRDEKKNCLFSSLIPHPSHRRYLSVALSLSFGGRPQKGVRLGRWALPTTVSCGARTFLPEGNPLAATAWPTPFLFYAICSRRCSHPPEQASNASLNDANPTSSAMPGTAAGSHDSPSIPQLSTLVSNLSTLNSPSAAQWRRVAFGHQDGCVSATPDPWRCERAEIFVSRNLCCLNRMQ